MPSFALACHPNATHTLPLLHEPIKKSCWSPSKSSSLYKVDGWGAPYFFINGQGHMAIRPAGHDTRPHQEIDIMQIVQDIVECRTLEDHALPTPLVLRFPDVLRDRLEKLQFAFECAIQAFQYQGKFQGIFPVKCNQDRFVVENIVEFGKPYRFGLEAGSKSELLLAMASLCKGNPDALLVCNGYKDDDYVCMALMAKQMQLNCVIVLEQEQELDVVLKISQQLGVEPLLGIRAKLNTKCGGHFGESSGFGGKFGLSYAEIVRIVNKLQKAGKLSCLQLLHFHVGSQIPSFSILHDGVNEAGHIYCELDLMGANMQWLDIGGGLGIDYDGSASVDSDMSVGYTMEEYAKEVVGAVKAACAMKGVKEPVLCCESGRALVSHHSVLVFDVLSAYQISIEGDKGVSLEVDGTLPEALRELHRSLVGFAKGDDHNSTLACANKLKEYSITYFKQGKLRLPELAAINSLYEAVSAYVEQKKQSMWSAIAPHCSKSFGPFLSNGQENVSHNAIYHINLSIFKSLPDAWAIGQLFPIVPLHRLEEEPTVNASLSDITCDSDGKVTTFVGTDAKGDRMSHMRVHPLQEGKPYFMGMFLGGAYQEALGSMHNMIGAPPVVHVLQCGQGGGMAKLKVMKLSDGQHVADVLRCMRYDPDVILKVLRKRVQKCFKEGRFGEDKRELVMEAMHLLACSLESSTYLTINHCSSSIISNLVQTHAKV